MTPYQRQIASTHLELIQLAAYANSAEQQQQLQQLVEHMQNDGWHNLSLAMQAQCGLKPVDLLTDSPQALDEEDQAILELIHFAQKQPAAFAEFAQAAQSAQQHTAAQALAALVYAATQGEREALEALAELQQAADSPAALATSSALIAMIEGERDPARLSQNLPDEQAQLIRNILLQLDAFEA